MRTNLNLSRRPFTNRRLFWLSIFALLIMTFGFALWVATEKARIDLQIGELTQQIKQQESRVKKLQEQAIEEAVEIPKTVLTDQQIYELASARILLSRKGFSWNRLLSDIELRVPQKVRLMSIKIEEGGKANQDGAAAIEVKALGRTAAQMTEMMEGIEKSGGVFALDQAVQDATSESGEVPFTLKLVYRPGRGDA